MAQRALITDRPALLDPPPRAEPGRPLSEEAYLRLALVEPDRKWELIDGVLSEKPDVSLTHGIWTNLLSHRLNAQLGDESYFVLVEGSRVRRPNGGYLIPDLCVVRTDYLFRTRQSEPAELGVLTEPLPLVVEVWSPSTGAYDSSVKLDAYRARGDLEIWQPRPFERLVVIWRRHADGSYARSEHRGGVVEPIALPGVRINLDELFDRFAGPPSDV